MKLICCDTTITTITTTTTAIADYSLIAKGMFNENLTTVFRTR